MLTLEAIRELESGTVPPYRDSSLDCFGWGAYDLDQFVRLLHMAIKVAPGKRFVDLGCGIGTKCLTAEIWGLDAVGVERYGPYAQKARELGVLVDEMDVRHWAGAHKYDIVYLSHPLRPGPELIFETWLHSQMRPGSVLMTLRGAAKPVGWREVVHEQYRRSYDEPGRWRGVFVKPER